MAAKNKNRPALTALQTAAASSDVLPDEAVPFPDPAARDGVVEVPAGTYRMMRTLAVVGSDVSARGRRERALSAAVSAGRITRERVSAWRATYNRDPRGTARQLEALPATAQAAGSSSRPSSPSPARGEVSPLAVRPHRGLTAAPEGEPFRGFPTRLNAVGEPCVFTIGGWITTAAAHDGGVTDEQLRSAVAVASLTQGGRAAQAFRAGP